MSQQIGLVGLAVMGQNLALNIAEEGFAISVFNRSPEKVDETVARAKREGDLPVTGFKDVGEFVRSLETPRRIILLVKAGAPVDATLDTLLPHLEAGDIVIDGGNEYFENTERRSKAFAAKGLRFFGMGVSGGEEGARNGPSLMPGGDKDGYELLFPILSKVAAQVDDGPCVTYIGPGGAGHYVKMVHNGIEYGDMQLISETYDVLKNIGGLNNTELAETFSAWNQGELKSFLIEITAQIFTVKDDQAGSTGFLVDKIVDATGMKGTGKWTVQQGAELSSAIPTIASAVEARVLSARRDERIAASKVLQGPEGALSVERKQLIDDVRSALYAAKICSYAQGMNLLRAASTTHAWGLKLGEISRIWKGGCIIRAQFLDRIKGAYDRDADLVSLFMDPEFAAEMNARQEAWRRVVTLAINAGIAVPSMTASLAYYDTCRRARLPANLVQAQRDLFGAHTFERTDRPGSFHADWNP